MTESNLQHEPGPGAGWFVDARYGMVIHYGLYSLLGRGEWVLNREQIPHDQYRSLAERFSAEAFDADALCDLAVRGGMRYITFTTMHHDGFRLYDTQLSDFNSVRACGRDLTAEIIAAARRRGLKVVLYHSLNNWNDTPDAVAALEDEAAYQVFIDNTFARIRELVTRYNPIDVLWYDGWWPFNAQKWRGEEMNAMVRAIQPHILFNGRNGLPGDFATPEGHLGSPSPWRPWEACITLNDSWGFNDGDTNWKSPGAVVDMLATCAAGRGNLLLNIGPRGDGSVPQASADVITEVGNWLQKNGDCIFDTDRFVYSLTEQGAPGENRSDWCHHGPYTARGNVLFLLLRRPPQGDITIAGLQAQVQRVEQLHDGSACSFVQEGGRVIVSALAAPPTSPATVLRYVCDRPPVVRLSGGMRTARVAHPPYDPCPSDLAH